MLVGADAFYQIATMLKDATLDRLRVDGRPSPIRSYVTTGQVAWDVCDCDGQLAVTIAQTYLAYTFPGGFGGTPGIGLPPCEIPYRVADLQVHLIRCAANPDDSGIPPANDLDASANEVIVDGAAVLAGTLCKLGEMQDDNIIAEFMMGVQTMMGPAGGCVGTQTAVQVGLPNVCPC